jgi:hypothetical protein
MTFKSPTQPLCRWCGKPIPKWTRNLYFGQSPRSDAFSRSFAEKPANREDAQRLVNEKIVSVRYWDTPDEPRHVHMASSWDGESYTDQFFHSADCARAMGYAAAHNGWTAEAYDTATAARRTK